MTIASFEIAKLIRRDAYGLIFGINMFFGVGAQTLLTFVVADANGLALEIRDQFYVYGSLYLIAGTAFSIFFLSARLVRLFQILILIIHSYFCVVI